MASARRRAGLIDQRCPLRRGYAEVNRFDLEIPAVVSDAVYVLRPREHALRAVAQHCPVFPAAFPQLVDDLHVFFGDTVTRVVLRLARKADAFGGAVEISGDHISA